MPASTTSTLADRAAAILGPGGEVSAVLDGYEAREEQLRMAREVADALTGGRVLACEAGTGTGKSLAYLVPALLWARSGCGDPDPAEGADEGERRGPVVCATRTIPLQDQLLGSDLPLLEEALPFSFEAALAVGRGNFLSRRRLGEALEEAEMFPDEETVELSRIGRAAAEGRGRRSDLGFRPSGKAWDRVRSDADNCLGSRCPQHAECFYYDMRRALDDASVIVANHHLVLADLAIKRAAGASAGVLPPYRTLVVDEAHHLEEAASEHLGVRLSLLGILQRLGRLRPVRGKGGVLPHLGRVLPELGPGGGEAARRLDEEVDPALERARSAVRHASDVLPDLVRAQAARSEGRDPPDAAQAVLRPGRSERGEWPAILEHVRTVAARAADLARALSGVCEEAEEATDRAPSEAVRKVAAPLLEAKAEARRLLAVEAGLGEVMEVDDGSCARWVEVASRRRRSGVTFRVAPIDVGEVLAEELFGRLHAAVLTSATLAVGDSFAFLERRLGIDRLPAERRREAIHPSPFAYPERTALGIPTDGPEPTDGAYPRVLADRVLEAVDRTGGGAFVLFTSFSLLDATWRRTESELAGRGFVLCRHGDGARSALLERFREAGERGVLFGVDSFWEGVDVPGPALRHVIVTRLPFRPPSDPLAAARARRLKKEGGSPFRELSLPEAAIRLKQGVGRLLRNTRDAGLVTILDPRLATRGYGRVFRRALPPFPVEVGPWEEVRAWLDERARALGVHEPTDAP